MRAFISKVAAVSMIGGAALMISACQPKTETTNDTTVTEMGNESTEVVSDNMTATDAATMGKSFDWGVHLIREFVTKNKLPSRFIIGEFGEYWDLHPTSERMRALVDASIAAGVEYLFNWVLYDQPGNKDDHERDASHFGKYSLDRMLTPQGKEFQSWFVARPAIPRKPAAKAAGAK